MANLFAALVGCVFGAVAGVATGLVLKDYRQYDYPIAKAVAGAVVGAIAGAIVGAMVGQASRKIGNGRLVSGLLAGALVGALTGYDAENILYSVTSLPIIKKF
ncbi:MAG TPA: hypothetical protein VKI65_04630 [Gemmataceae bacterium]|nr:hypothetical protein [Gemmataceae bacterium]